MNRKAELKEDYFATEPIKKLVLAQIIPAIVSQMITLLYNLADTYFVGQMNEPKQTAAITVVFSSFLMLTAISNLFGIGGSSMVSHCMGLKKEEMARAASAVSFWFGLLAAIGFSVAFFVFRRPVLMLCGASGQTYELAQQYAIWVIVLGGPFVILNTLLANLVRAEGKAVNASFGVSLGGIINIVLDPFLVLPAFLGWGAVGAGIATAISNIVATIYFLILICKKGGFRIINIRPSYLVKTKAVLGSILKVGFPSAVQYALTVVAVAAQAKFVSAYSTQAVAALGIVKKLDQLPLYFSIGVANGLLPVLAYNYASGDLKRQQKGFRFGCIIAFSFSLICFAAYEVWAPALASLFIKDPKTIRYSAAFLRRMVIAMPMVSINYPMIIQFQAMGKVSESLICSILRKGVIDIPLLYLMDALIPLYGCMWVQPIVDGITLVVSILFYLRIQKKTETRLQ